jgi:hypothetical protein
MPNHIHLFFRTPQANLSRGMQYLLSGYANWYAKRHQHTGHLFQGRFKGELIEDESYFWTVSRYIHLNPIRGKRPLVQHPMDWRWSSYPGYAKSRNRVDYVAYDNVYQAWQGEAGGRHPSRAYRRFVESGVADPPVNPLVDAWEGWLLGSEQFRESIKSRFAESVSTQGCRQARRLRCLDPVEIVRTVADYFEQQPSDYQRRRSSASGRDLAAYLAHRRTMATLGELADLFGLTNPDSVSNLIRRAERRLAQSASERETEKRILEFLKTENRI